MSEREYLSKAEMRGNKQNGWDTGEAAERCEGMKIWRRWRANTAEQESGPSVLAEDESTRIIERPRQGPEIANNCELFGVRGIELEIRVARGLQKAAGP